jgi:hypothetical protein
VNASIDDEQDPANDALVSQLAVIEAQPLDDRAASYAQLHDQLQARLEGTDLPRFNG